MVVPIMFMYAHACLATPGSPVSVLPAYCSCSHQVHSVLNGNGEIGPLHAAAEAGKVDGDDAAELIKDRPTAISRIRRGGVLVLVARGVIVRVVAGLDHASHDSGCHRRLGDE